MSGAFPSRVSDASLMSFIPITRMYIATAAPKIPSVDLPRYGVRMIPRITAEVAQISPMLSAADAYRVSELIFFAVLR